MSDNLCACGHREQAHGPDCIVGWSANEPNRKCRCSRFRLSLDWPDSEGWWWCDKIGLVRSHIDDTDDFIELISGDFLYRKTVELQHGPARFTKLLERNPYEPTPG